MSKGGDIYEQILAALIQRNGGRIEVPFEELQDRKTVTVTSDPGHGGTAILTLRRPQDDDDIESRRDRGGQL